MSSIRIKHLFISPGHNFIGHHGEAPSEHPMVECAEVRCLANRGIEGDRFLDFKADYKGQVTFFSNEVYEEVCAQFGVRDKAASAFRRNIIVEGADLNALIGRKFEVQGVRFLGTQESAPCHWMNTAFAPGAEDALKGRGGLRAKVLCDGVLRVTAKTHGDNAARTRYIGGMKRILLPLFLLTVSAGAVDLAGDFKGPLGLQLYSLRDSFKADVPGSLDKVKAFGFTDVETASTYGLGAEKLLAMMKERGLNPVSGHFQYDALTKDLAGAVAEAKALGLKFAACPWIPHEEGIFGEAEAKKAATDFNKFGEAFKAAGITFAYHCHGYEFKPFAEAAGGNAFDVLVRETKPELVSFEMDVFWVVHPGQDPVKLLAKYPGRWALMHLKDIRKGAQTGIYTGHAPLTDDVPLGTGMVDWPAVLKQAAQSGVKHYFIEDESPTVMDALPVTTKYLGGLKF